MSSIAASTIHSPTRLPIFTLADSLTRSRIHWSTHSFTNLLTHSLVRWFTYSLTHTYLNIFSVIWFSCCCVLIGCFSRSMIVCLFVSTRTSIRSLPFDWAQSLRQWRIVSVSNHIHITHIFIHSHIHLLTDSPTHSYTCPLTRSFTHSPTHSLICPITHSLTRPLTHSPYHPLTHSPTHSFVSKTLSLKHSRLSLQSGSLPLFLAVEAGSLGVTKELLSLQAEQQLKAHKPVGKAAGTRSLSTRGLSAIGAAWWHDICTVLFCALFLDFFRQVATSHSTLGLTLTVY